MTPKKFGNSKKLTKRREFVRLFDKPQSHKGRRFLAYWKENNKNRSRLGITLKGKTNSIWRNRLKRLIREWFRNLEEDKNPVDINIVINLPKEPDFSYLEALKKEIYKWRTIA